VGRGDDDHSAIVFPQGCRQMVSNIADTADFAPIKGTVFSRYQKNFHCIS
jgi:hypothetical protein